jgi:hypothetical protein
LEFREGLSANESPNTLGGGPGEVFNSREIDAFNTAAKPRKETFAAPQNPWLYQPLVVMSGSASLA